jgi:formylglycine-generating enzyme required for sulfatase activity
VRSPSIVRRRLLVVLVCAAPACIGLQDLGNTPSDGSVGDGAVSTDGSPSDVAAIDSRGDASSDVSVDASVDAAVPGDMVLVSAGAFQARWSGAHNATSLARLTHDFYLDAHEVTVGQFRKWVDAGMPSPCPAGEACSLDPGGVYADSMRWYPADDPVVKKDQFKTTACSSGAGDPRTYTLADDSLPINCVTYAQAVAVCSFRGLRLPTDIEWFHAASKGGTRTYPWGDTAPATCADAIFGRETESNVCGFPKSVPTATLDVSFEGAHDLGGSLAEWVYGGVSWTFGPPNPLPDDWAGEPRGAGSTLGARGGSFVSKAEDVKAAHSATPFEMFGHVDVGFRCAKTR